MKHLYIITLLSIITGVNLHAADPESKLIGFYKEIGAVNVEDSIRECLKRNDVNVLVNGQGFLHLAAARGAIDVMQMLYDKSADLNLQNNIDYTPLHSAATLGRSEAITFLLARGADSRKRNFLKKTPADLARDQGHANIAKLIDNYEYIEDIKEPECK